MPIKKRRKGGVAETSEAPKPPKPKTAVKIKKRSPMSSKYVYTDQGVLVVRTPAATVKWDNDFRMRIVFHYAAPRTLMPATDYQRKFEQKDFQTKTYRVEGNEVGVCQPAEYLGTSQVVVLRTDVINYTTGKRMFLSHKDPAMRMLMVYCFLRGEVIGGVPKLVIDDFLSGC